VQKTAALNRKENGDTTKAGKRRHYKGTEKAALEENGGTTKAGKAAVPLRRRRGRPLLLHQLCVPSLLQKHSHV